MIKTEINGKNNKNSQKQNFVETEIILKINNIKKLL